MPGPGVIASTSAAARKAVRWAWSGTRSARPRETVGSGHVLVAVASLDALGEALGDRAGNGCVGAVALGGLGDQPGVLGGERDRLCGPLGDGEDPRVDDELELGAGRDGAEAHRALGDRVEDRGEGVER